MNNVAKLKKLQPRELTAARREPLYFNLEREGIDLWTQGA